MKTIISIIITVCFFVRAYAEIEVDVLTMKDISFLAKDKISALEKSAFNGSPRDAYLLGRYHQYCLEDEKTAAVWYYVATCFNYRAAENRLAIILVKLTEEFDYDPAQIFQGNHLDRVQESGSEIMKNFIAYHKSVSAGILTDSSGTYLQGKVNPKLLKTWSELNKESPRIIGFDRPIEHDELEYEESNALRGNTHSIKKLFSFYRYVDPKCLDQEYKSAVWMYVAAMAGLKDAPRCLIGKSAYKDSMRSVFEGFVGNKIKPDNPFEENFVMFNYYFFTGDDDAAKIHKAWLQKNGVDEKFLKPRKDFEE